MIRSAAVLGAGTMGSQIGAHLANAGVPTLLLDLSANVASDGLQRARRLKPDPFFGPEVPALIATGGFDRDLERIAQAGAPRAGGQRAASRHNRDVEYLRDPHRRSRRRAE